MVLGDRPAARFAADPRAFHAGRRRARQELPVDQVDVERAYRREFRATVAAAYRVSRGLDEASRALDTVQERLVRALDDRRERIAVGLVVPTPAEARSPAQPALCAARLVGLSVAPFDVEAGRRRRMTQTAHPRTPVASRARLKRPSGALALLDHFPALVDSLAVSRVADVGVGRIKGLATESPLAGALPTPAGGGLARQPVVGLDRRAREGGEELLIGEVGERRRSGVEVALMLLASAAEIRQPLLVSELGRPPPTGAR